jgi:hypothetical protein
MHIRIKHSALAALVLCAGLASMHSVSADDRRAAVTVEKRAVGAFSAIELARPFRVIVTEGAPRLELSGEARQLAEIETEVRKGTLVVRQRSRSGFHIHFGKRDHEEASTCVG